MTSLQLLAQQLRYTMDYAKDLICISESGNENLKSSDSDLTSSSSSDTVMGESLMRTIPVSCFEVNLKEALKKATYEPADIKQIVGSIVYLNQEQKASLFKVLKKHKGLFQGRCKQWTRDKVSIELKQDASSFYGKADPIPLKQLEITKNKVYCHCEIGALWELKVKDVEKHPLAFLAFGVTKKDGTIQLVIDFRKLKVLTSYY